MEKLLLQMLAVFLLIIVSPMFLFIFLIVKLTTNGQFIFKQKRAGKDNKSFFIYKIRTMIVDAENQRQILKNLNEADGPVFKIHNDPRYTKIGRFLSHTGLDELPQLINIIKGEMVFVGPRPLPVAEARMIPQKYQRRLDVLPGITSPWILQGAHKLSFREWMESDLIYIRKKSLWYDAVILSKSFLLVSNFIYKKIFNIDEKS
jgi:lipopolysaccharide/colanic/teichoic acid biosynthesis glycosyltransferase